MNDVWNLEPIYKGFDSSEFQADMKRLSALADTLEVFCAQLTDEAALSQLRKGISLQEDLTSLVDKLAGCTALR